MMTRISGWAGALRRALSGPQVMAFVPAATLGAFWLGGEAALIATALVCPLIVGRLTHAAEDNAPPPLPRDTVTGLVHRSQFLDTLDAHLHDLDRTHRKTAYFAIELDEFAGLAEKYGPDVSEALLSCTAHRLQGVMRDREMVSRSGDFRFSVALDPVRNLDLESSIQLATRLQTAIEEPISADGNLYYVSCCVGFCLSNRAPGRGAKALHDGAVTALAEAQRTGPSTIRSYSEEVRLLQSQRLALCEDITAGLDAEQFHAWFQPQISTDTGEISGFETLARWLHPTRGLVSPGEFLPLMERNGQLDRLGQTMLNQALRALALWDQADVTVPRVGVNFTADELRNPRLVDRVEWALDRHDVTPDRLCVEILEDVVSRAPDDVTSRNIKRLAELGCTIDLDDFGTGNTSISSLRRFPVTRLKIDRSFVSNADQSVDQQRMISAILTMAERLDLQTLAEGIETPGEHAMVAQLGCGSVQGFGIARPMPFDKTVDWIREYNAQRHKTPVIGRRTG
ncbi:putative bifunctional diguanylate cyclase/phosphodiesterase [Pseudaestuariivita atlantica]|nr:bifunctional diguanylate cyclase/phosphodiesterase [Pseudaestuariivita atlantica]